MFDVTGELSKLPSSSSGVCEVAERFVTAWFGPLAEADGCASDEIANAENELGFRLPAALRWLYSRLGRRDDLVRRQDPLLEIENLSTDEASLVFRRENQQCALWGVRFADIEDEDPPVAWKNPQDGDDAPWQQYQDRLSAALLELILSESMLSSGRNVLHREADEGALAGLPAGFEPLPELDHVFWPMPEGPKVQWFGSSDTLLRSDGETWLWLFARTPSALDDARDLLPGPWERLDVLSQRLILDHPWLLNVRKPA